MPPRKRARINAPEDGTVFSELRQKLEEAGLLDCFLEIPAETSVQASEFVSQALQLLQLMEESRAMACAESNELAETHRRLLQLDPPYVPHIPPTPGDGNCFFHSLCQLWHHPVQHQNMREAICTFLETGGMNEAVDIFLTGSHLTKEEYLLEMRQLGTYADNLVVAASSMFLGVCIRIVSATGEPILINACDSEANVDSMLTMGYLRDKHYYASVPVQVHSSATKNVSLKATKVDVPQNENSPIKFHIINFEERPTNISKTQKNGHKILSLPPFDPNKTAHSNILRNLSACLPMMKLYYDWEQVVEKDLRIYQLLENSLLNISCHPRCAAGIIYIDLHKVGNIYLIMVIETGLYHGFISKSLISQLTKLPLDSFELLYLYTSDDLDDMQSNFVRKFSNSKNVEKRKHRPDKKYADYLHKNDSSIVKCLDKLNCGEHSRLVHVVREGFAFDLTKRKSNDWYIHCSGIFKDQVEKIEKSLFDYTRQVNLGRQFHYDLSKLASYFSTLDLAQQSHVISGLSNKFWKNNNTFSRSKRILSEGGMPTSARMQVIKFMLNDNGQDATRIVVCLIEPDPNVTSGVNSLDHNVNYATSNALPKTSKRRVVIRLNKEDLLLSSGENMSSIGSSINLFDNFSSNMERFGQFHYRVRGTDKDVVCLNDIHPITGAFMMDKFVHITIYHSVNGPLYSCPCKTYKTLQSLASKHSDTATFAAKVQGMTCCHARLMSELEDIVSCLSEGRTIECPSQKQTSMVIAGWESRNKIIVQLSSASDCAKFSVKSDDEVVVVSIYKQKNSKNYIVRCSSGACYCNYFKGSSRRHKSLDGDVCPHLKIIRDNESLWSNLCSSPMVVFDEDAENGISDVGASATSAIDEDPTEEADLPLENDHTQNVFNEETGLWQFKCLSQHKPQPDGSDLLEESCSLRNTFISKKLMLQDGYYRGPRLIPPLPSKSCDCKAGWSNDESPDGILELTRILNVFTTLGVLKCEVYLRKCINNSCTLLWDEGKSTALHVLSHFTAAGDEIGYMFHDSLLNDGKTFSGFCSDMNNIYRRYNKLSRPFMSHTTFTKWWLSWASSHQIDFRMPCPICKSNPKVLAGDGTKIGICLKNASYDAIEHSTSEVIPTLHKRMDRCFLSYNGNFTDGEVRIARQQLNQLATEKNVFQSDKDKEKFLSILPDMCREEIERFILGNMQREAVPFSRLLTFLASTVPLFAILPPKYVQKLKFILQHVNRNDNINTQTVLEDYMDEIGTYCVELHQYLSFTKLLYDDIPSSTINFLNYICDKVENTELLESEEACEQNETYNPAKFGRAYYFTTTGQKVRNIRQFKIGPDAAEKDDITCSKLYKRAAGNGMTYLFVWHCALHSWCLGYHMIDGGEGCKDPFSSLYSYLPESPEVIYYDNACQFHEYCLNRESGYYANTQFFHDIFHSYTHKCPPVYRSKRLTGLDSANTSICEQFNSFLASLRSSSGQMSQSTFSFLVQYFIYAWNMEKKKKLDKYIEVALSCNVHTRI